MKAVGLTSLAVLTVLLTGACTDDFFYENPCDSKEYANHEVCTGERLPDGEICESGVFENHPACIEWYCERDAPTHYLEDKCLTPERKITAEIQAIHPRSGLCLTDPFFGIKRSEHLLTEIRTLLAPSINRMCFAHNTRMERHTCVTMFMRGYYQFDTPCATCFAEYGECELDRCGDFCWSDRPFFGSEEELEAAARCKECLSPADASCVDTTIECTVEADRCADLVCNGFECDRFAGTCMNTCDPLTHDGCEKGFVCTHTTTFACIRR